jgi:hypothetical protein
MIRRLVPRFTEELKLASPLGEQCWAVISGVGVMMNLTYDLALRLVNEKAAAGEHCAYVVTNAAAERMVLSAVK